MRFVSLYLIGYFILLAGAALALWRAGVLGRIAPAWIAIGLLIAIGLGVMLAVSSGKPGITNDN